MTDLKKLEESIGYTFKDKSLLKKALTHPSYVNERKMDRIYSNQRLEFFGDAVLSVAVSEYIFLNLKSYPEGKLTELRAKVVCEKSLAVMARNICIGKYLILGNGEIKTNGADRDSTLSDAMEAVIAAVYLDGGFETAKKLVLDNMTELIEQLTENEADMHNCKSELQELVQKNSRVVTYKTLGEKGPEHSKMFEVAVMVDDKVIATGVGASKKKAEQNAAEKALHVLKK